MWMQGGGTRSIRQIMILIAVIIIPYALIMGIKLPKRVTVVVLTGEKEEIKCSLKKSYYMMKNISYKTMVSLKTLIGWELMHSINIGWMYQTQEAHILKV